MYDVQKETRYSRRLSALALASALALTAGNAAAGEWRVGGNLLAGNNPYEDGDDWVGLMPTVAYQGERFHANLGNPGISFFRGAANFGGLGYSLYSSDNFQFDLIGRLRMMGLDPDEEDEWYGLDERKPGFDAGVSLLWQTAVGEVDLELLTDVSDRSDGQEILVSYAYPITQGQWTIRPEIGVSWQSSDLTDYYFGVDSDEVRAGRAAYEADASVTPFAGVQVEYAVSTQMHVTGGVGVGRFGDEISDSPIVDGSSLAGGYLGLTYTF